MRKSATWMFLLAWLLAAVAHAQDVADKATIAALQQQRLVLLENKAVDLAQLSADVRSTLKATTTLWQSDQNKAALAQLQALETYAPLNRLPSYDVQLLCAAIYRDLKQPLESQGCRERALAMQAILLQLSGTGDTPADPVRVLMASDMMEWLRLRSANVTSTGTVNEAGMTLQQVTYTLDSTPNRPMAVYFRVGRSAAATPAQPSDHFSPKAAGSLTPVQGEAVAQAKRARAAFLADRRFDYDALMQLSRGVLRQASQLSEQGQPVAALAKLREIERIRPIEQTPIINVIAMYSTLLGKTGDTRAQERAQMQLFGLVQAMAQSGDGLTAATAVQIVAMPEASIWLSDKGAQIVQETQVQEGGRTFDAVATKDAQGRSRTYYFDITALLARDAGR